MSDERSFFSCQKEEEENENILRVLITLCIYEWDTSLFSTDFGWDFKIKKRELHKLKLK